MCWRLARCPRRSVRRRRPGRRLDAHEFLSMPLRSVGWSGEAGGEEHAVTCRSSRRVVQRCELLTARLEPASSASSARRASPLRRRRRVRGSRGRTCPPRPYWRHEVACRLVVDRHHRQPLRGADDIALEGRRRALERACRRDRPAQNARFFQARKPVASAHSSRSADGIEVDQRALRPRHVDCASSSRRAVRPSAALTSGWPVCPTEGCRAAR